MAKNKGVVSKKFDKVLYVRVCQDMLDRLEDVRKQRIEQNKGVVMSVADVARTMLWKAIEAEVV